MSTFMRIASVLLLSSTAIFAQVGIGTANLASSSLLELESTTAAFVMPRMTDTQMTAINGPLTGSLIFNTSENLPYFKGDLGWSSFHLNANPTIILSRSGGTMNTSAATSYPIALTAANVVSNSSAYFTVDGPGAITVARSGVYLLAASLSTSNMPAGNRTYFLAVYKNNTLIGYLNKSKLENPAADYWGMSGNMMYYAQTGDQFTFKYFVNYTASLANVIQTICITKLN